MTEIPDIANVSKGGESTKYVAELSDGTRLKYRLIYDGELVEEKAYPDGESFNYHSEREVSLPSSVRQHEPPEIKIRMTVLSSIEFLTSFYRWDVFKSQVYDPLVETIIMSQNDIKETIHPSLECEHKNY